MRRLLRILRNPGMLQAVLKYAATTAGDDRRAELVALRRLRAQARKSGAKPGYILRSRAAEAQLHLRLGEPDRARRELLNILKSDEVRHDDVGKQVELFCRYWIATIDGNPFQASYWSRRARELGLKNGGLAKIPPPYEPTDEYDEEFKRIEAELEKEFDAQMKSSKE